MAVKSDNPEYIGRHCFEVAGLGRAPFRFVGFYTAKYQACPGAPVQPGACCDYCGTGIMYVCDIQDADGKHFKVGCDCVSRTGDAGLVKAYKKSAEYRQLQREKREDLDRRKALEWSAILEDPAAVEKLKAFMVPTWDGKGEESYYVRATRIWPSCGAAGRARYLSTAKKIIAGELS